MQLLLVLLAPDPNVGPVALTSGLASTRGPSQGIGNLPAPLNP